MVVKEKGNLFDITATSTLPALADPEEFSCELRIPQANYTVRRETVFYPGKCLGMLTYPLSPGQFHLFYSLLPEFPRRDVLAFRYAAYNKALLIKTNDNNTGFEFGTRKNLQLFH